MQPLPIDAHLPQIVSTLRISGALVLTAPPGSGKTTRIPRALYDAGFAENGEILVLEPRRLAARLAAARVAEEMGEAPGDTVGYSIRFENVSGPKTKIRFLTEAILTRRLTGDPALSDVSAVILDEFHERHIETDIGLALVKQARNANPYLKLLVMQGVLYDKYDNRAEIDIDEQTMWLMQKFDISGWDDEQIKTADTSTFIFVLANIRLQDSIEDLKFSIFI